MRYLSVCSGIEAATVAWHPLGWEAAAFSEIERFPRAVLAHHYPDVPLHGDFTTIQGDEYGPVDVLVGGTPCQSFSVAGLRKGMDDPRGNLALAYLGLAARTRARWLVWENVPGVLSSSGGRDFGAFLGGLAELGYGWAYRVLDAQHFGVPQRRRRVYVVGYRGDWRRAAAVLFERESLQGNTPPSREAGEGSAPGSGSGVEGGGVAGTFQNTGHGWWNESDVAQGLRTPKGSGSLEANVVAHTLRAEGFDASEDGTGRGTPLVPTYARDIAPALTSNYAKQPDNSDTALGPNLIAFDTTQVTSKANRSNPKPGDPCHPLAAVAHPPAVAFGWQNSPSQSLSDSEHTVPTLDKSKTPAVAFSTQQTPKGWDMELGTCPTLQVPSPSGGGQPHAVMAGMAVRRITPREAERLQGFPDNYTRIPYRGKPAEDCPDGPRYKALGNSMAVPVMAWIGSRIAMVEAL